MLLKNSILKRIKAGEITLAFRKWKRPTVKTGGTLRTSVGVLAIDRVWPIAQKEIDESDAKQAGYSSKSALLNNLNRRDSGTIYRISLHYKGPDPRKVLQKKDNLSKEELARIRQQLKKLDEQSSGNAWAQSVLEIIEKYPGLPAADLARKSGFEKEWLKAQIRKLKELGLTVSLLPGYRLSARGKVVVEYLKNRG